MGWSPLWVGVAVGVLVAAPLWVLLVLVVAWVSRR